MLVRVERSDFSGLVAGAAASAAATAAVACLSPFEAITHCS